MPNLRYNIGDRVRWIDLVGEEPRQEGVIEMIKCLGKEGSYYLILDNGWEGVVQENALTIMNDEPACPHCGSHADPWWSRMEPMGYICSDCGKDVDEKPVSVIQKELENLGAFLKDIKMFIVGSMIEEEAHEKAAHEEQRAEQWKKRIGKPNRLLLLLCSVWCKITGKR